MASSLRPRRFFRLLAADAMNISRDPMLMSAVVMSILPAIIFAISKTAMDDAALAAFGIEQFSRYLVPFVLVLPTVLIGWVTGFLLLEDRDDGVLLAVDTTPVGKAGFLIYRVTVTALLGGAITIGALALIAPGLDIGRSVLIVAAVAMECILVATTLPAIARNRVEGLALTKLLNIAAIVPLIAIVPSPWRLLAGIVPTYWIGEVTLVESAELPMAVVVMVGTAFHAGWMIWLLAAYMRHTG